MKWIKLKKIFDPTQQVLNDKIVEYAQSPQVLQFDDFFRIYFSTRERDSSGKFISHIAFIDIDKQFEKIIQISNKPVLPQGELGCYDEHGIFPLNILREGDTILGFISGWSRRISVDVETSIGLAFSYDNGLTFQRCGNGPILGASLEEPFLVGDPFVLKLDEIYHMWYIYGIRWLRNPENEVRERVYKIGQATSKDKINWIKTNKQIIDDKINPDECQALPTVVFHKGKYHMFFCYRHAIGFRNDPVKSYKIGYAWSVNALDWNRDDEEGGLSVTEGSWDSEMMCYPHVFKCDDSVYLLYNGNSFGKFGFGIAKLDDAK